MLHWVLPLVLGLPPADDAAKAELEALAKSVEEATNYAFTINALAGHKAPKNPAQPPTTKPKSTAGEAPRDLWTAQVQRDHVMHFMKGHAEFYREGHRYVALGRGDAWENVELPPRTEGESARGDKLRGLSRLVFEIDRIPLPHRVLARLGAKVGDVTRTEKDGKIEYVATLTEQTVREMMGGKTAKKGEPGGDEPPIGEDGEGDEGGEKGGAAEGKAPAAPAAPVQENSWSGTLKVVASKDPKPAIESMALDLHSRSAAGERNVHRDFTISGVNATNFVVPDPAVQLLQERG